MEKITFSEKLKNSPEFQRGKMEFLESKVQAPKTIKCFWYRAKITRKEWIGYFSKINSFTYLDEEKNNVGMGFLAVIPPPNCLKITNLLELRKLDLHRRAINLRPFLFEENPQ